jgi:hypothetical protein
MLLLDDSHDVAFLHNQKVLAINFNFRARPFAVKDFVTLFDVECLSFSVLALSAVADSNNLAFLRLFLRCVRDDDATGGFLFRR